MTAPFDQDDEPTATFVPTWDDEDDRRVAAAEAPRRAGDDPEAGAAAVGAQVRPDEAVVASPASPPAQPESSPGAPVAGWAFVPDEPEVVVDAPVLDEAVGVADGAVGDPPAAGGADPVVEAPVVADEPADDGAGSDISTAGAERDEADPGALRPLAPEPAFEARRTRSAPPPASPSAARRTWDGLRAVGGLLVLVVVAGVGLAATIGLVLLGIAFVLQQAVGD